MSGLGLDSSMLPLFQSQVSTRTSTLLDALYGTSADGSGSADPLPALQAAEANRTTEIARTAAGPEVTRDLAAFSAAVASAKTPADLLKKPAFLKVFLTASGLADQTQYPALAQKALLSDPAKPDALVNHLSNTAWKTTAQIYQFATKRLTVIQDTAVQHRLKSGYAEVLWRQSLDTKTPGLSNAIDFRDRASQIKTVDQVLGDKTFRTVVTTALGIPQQIAFQELRAQEKSVSSRIDITRFSDPKFVDTFTKRYLLAAQAGTATAQSSSVTLQTLAIQSAGLVV